MIIICDICRTYVCPPPCPNFDGRVAGLGDPVGACEMCENHVYRDEKHHEHDGKIICTECAEELISPELLCFLGCKDIDEFFEMLY